MYFTPQQLSGGPRYSQKTRVGNWSEDIDMSSILQKNYLDKKDKGKLIINDVQQRHAKAFQRVPHTFSKDGLLRFQDHVLLMNKKTNGILVFDTGDKIISSDEAYACTTSIKDNGPCGRSVVFFQKIDEEGDDIVKYGQQIRIVTNQYIFHKPLYLYSTQCTPQTFARFSRFQEVCLNTQNNYNTVWKILPPGGPGSPLIGQPVQVQTELYIEHCATKELLSNDFIDYGNQFGKEYEVSAKRHAVKHKPQQLANETVGKAVINLSEKKTDQQNIWQIITAEDESAQLPIEQEAQSLYDEQQVINDIRNQLRINGIMSIRNASSLFDTSKLINEQELKSGLKLVGLDLNQQQVDTLISSFERNGAKKINLGEVIEAIRGGLSSYRYQFIRDAYKKLQSSSAGLVKLDDIAKLLDVSQHPDVVQGGKDQKDVYLKSLNLWNQQSPDAVIPIDQFTDYYRDISAAFESDEAFADFIKASYNL